MIFWLKSKWVQKALALLVILLMSFVGGILALKIAGPAEYNTHYGVVQFTATAAITGELNLYIPLAGWGIKTKPYNWPLKLQIELRQINRQNIIQPLVGGQKSSYYEEQLTAMANKVGHAALLRAAIYWISGALIGGVIASLMISAVLNQRTYLLSAPLLSGSVGCFIVFMTIWRVSHPTDSIWREPIFYGSGKEIPQLLDFSKQLQVASGRYENHYRRALLSLDNLLNFVQDGSEKRQQVILASDIHTNLLPLPAFKYFVGNSPVLLAGDFGQLGLPLENVTANQIAHLGSPTVAISGNHDSKSYMKALSDANAIVLGKDLTESEKYYTLPNGSIVAGYSDPLGANDQQFVNQDNSKEIKAFIRWFNNLPQRPDIVLVHRHSFGHALLDSLSPRSKPLIIMVGHDHNAHIEKVRNNILLDGGSLGAGGPWSVGLQKATFLSMQFEGSKLAYVTIVAIEPTSQELFARQIKIPDHDFEITLPHDEL